MLETVAGELREVEDYPTRVAMSADVVKLLAKREPKRCRQLLDALFEEALRAREPQVGDVSAARGQVDFDEVAQSIIKLAATFDSTLARAYTDRYAEIRNQADTAASAQGKMSPQVADLYLRLATKLVESDPALAVATASRTLPGAVSTSTLVFLETLRRRDIRLANEFLSSTLQSLTLRGGEDINELFLLYSYVFSPSNVLSVIDGRLVFRQISEYKSVVSQRPVDPALANRYLAAATQILLDPNRYAGGIGRLRAGAVGDLYFARIIEPPIHTFLPAASDSLRVRQSYLANNLDAAVVDDLQKRTDGLNSEQSAPERSAAPGSPSPDDLLNRADDTSDPVRRDRMYYTAAVSAVRDKRYETALAAVEKMSLKMRDEARQFIDYSIAEAKIRDGALEEGEQWARRDNEEARRAYLLTLIACSLVKGPTKDTARASQLLREVEQTATALGTNQEGLAVRVGMSAAYALYDMNDSFQLLRDVISTANKVDGFAGDIAITRNLRVGDFVFTYSFYDGEFAFTRVISKQARENFYLTLQEVQSLKSRLPRLKAVIAVCRAVLTTQKT
jgi:hypothetical protein